MPEATVHENSKALRSKVEIWATLHVNRVQPPPSNARADKCQPQNYLSTLVAFAPYGSHNSRAG